MSFSLASSQALPELACDMDRAQLLRDLLPDFVDLLRVVLAGDCAAGESEVAVPPGPHARSADESPGTD